VTLPALCFHLAAIAIMASREALAWRSGKLGPSVGWSVAMSVYGMLLLRVGEL